MADETWTVKRILEWVEGYLAQHGDESPRVSAQWLVGEALGVSRMQLFLDAERPLTQDERAVLRDWTRRRGAGEPLQYITGETAFRHITVKVRKGVLIPRPETEVLVSEALSLLPAAPKPQDAHDDALLALAERLTAERSSEENDETTGIGAVSNDAHSEAVSDGAGGTSPDSPGNGAHGTEYGEGFIASSADSDAANSAQKAERSQLTVVDLCTGTGCIACSIAYEHPLTHVYATDIASEAVALAHENVCALDLQDRVEVLECDLGSGVPQDALGSIDLVISNPPYVPTEVMGRIPSEVAHFEPALALDGGPDGLDVFRRILAWSAEALAPGGALAVELHETCLDQAAELAREAGFADVRIARDLADRPRILTARK